MSTEKPRYPKWIYHQTLPAKVIQTPEQLAAHLEDGWAETPAAFETPADAPTGADDPITEPATGHSLHDLSAKDAAALATDADLETITALLETEQANPNKEGGRPSVLKAFDKRIADLTAQ